MITRVSYKSYMTLHDYRGSHMTLHDYRDFCMMSNPGNLVTSFFGNAFLRPAKIEPRQKFFWSLSEVDFKSDFKITQWSNETCEGHLLLLVFDFRKQILLKITQVIQLTHTTVLAMQVFKLSV